MIEWWQALLISVTSSAAVGVFGLLSGFFVNIWTRGAAMAAEKRQARREARRDAMASVSRFLDMGSKVSAAHMVKDMISVRYDDYLKGNPNPPRMTLEQFQEQAMKQIDPPPSDDELTHAWWLAFGGCTPRRISRLGRGN